MQSIVEKQGEVMNTGIPSQAVSAIVRILLLRNSPRLQGQRVRGILLLLNHLE